MSGLISKVQKYFRKRAYAKVVTNLETEFRSKSASGSGYGSVHIAHSFKVYVPYRWAFESKDELDFRVWRNELYLYVQDHLHLYPGFDIKSTLTRINDFTREKSSNTLDKHACVVVVWKRPRPRPPTPIKPRR